MSIHCFQCTIILYLWIARMTICAHFSFSANQNTNTTFLYTPTWAVNWRLQGMHVKLEPRYQGAPRNTAGAGGGSKAAAAMSPTGPSGQIFCGELVGGGGRQELCSRLSSASRHNEGKILHAWEYRYNYIRILNPNPARKNLSENCLVKNSSQ